MDEVLSSALCAADWGQISRQAVARSPPVENRPPFVMLEWLPMLMGVEGGGGDESDNVKQGNNRTESKEERVQVAAALAAAALACPALRALPSSVTLRSSCRLGFEPISVAALLLAAPAGVQRLRLDPARILELVQHLLGESLALQPRLLRLLPHLRCKQKQEERGAGHGISSLGCY